MSAMRQPAADLRRPTAKIRSRQTKSRQERMLKRNPTAANPMVSQNDVRSACSASVVAGEPSGAMSASKKKVPTSSPLR